MTGALLDVAGEAIPLAALLLAFVLVPRWTRRDSLRGMLGDLRRGR